MALLERAVKNIGQRIGKINCIAAVTPITV